MKKVYILTAEATHWFLERGFSQVSVDVLPERKKQLHNYQCNYDVFVKLL